VSKCDWKPPEIAFGTWWSNWSDYWETGCDNAHTFFDGGPTENKYRFCPYCGKRIAVTEGKNE